MRVKPLILKALPLFPAGLLSSAIALTDQFFCEEISIDILRFHLFLAYIPFVLVTIGRIISIPIKVLANKFKDEKSEIYSSFISFSFLTMCTLLAVTTLIGIGVFQIYDFNKSYQVYSYLQIITGSLLILMSSFSFIFISEGKTKNVLIINTVTFFVNLGTSAFSLFTNDQSLALYIVGGASLLSVSLSILTQLYLLKKIEIKLSLIHI